MKMLLLLPIWTVLCWLTKMCGKEAVKKTVTV